jgi:phospholipid/cholesterol/gamma-HCH transport system permease protein
MVAIAMLREMGAVMTAIIMAGRTGAAFAAELATMQVNEEIDALGTLGIDPMEYLVLPRVLGLTLMMPLLCLYADVLGIVGGAVIGLTILDIPLLEYWTRTANATGFANLTIGVVKATVFGGLIGLAGCLRGLTAGRSAAAVGMATTSAVVTAIVMIVVVDGLFAVVLNFLGV